MPGSTVANGVANKLLINLDLPFRICSLFLSLYFSLVIFFVFLFELVL